MATKKPQSTNLEKAIERMAIGGRNQFADCFSNFLDLALSYLSVTSSCLASHTATTVSSSRPRAYRC